MNSAICHHRAHFESCNQIAPAQSAESLAQSPAPEWLFQQICTDYFENEGQSYLVVDRFSCWLTIYHFPINTKADSLIVHLKRLFMSYGVPEEISRDGRPQFSSSSFNIFLKDWGIHCRLSLATYPQSNGRAELSFSGLPNVLFWETQ